MVVNCTNSRLSARYDHENSESTRAPLGSTQPTVDIRSLVPRISVFSSKQCALLATAVTAVKKPARGGAVGNGAAPVAVTKYLPLASRLMVTAGTGSLRSGGSFCTNVTFAQHSPSVGLTFKKNEFIAG